jgi:hypothetical protein
MVVCYTDDCDICDITRGVPACKTSSACTEDQMIPIRNDKRSCNSNDWICSSQYPGCYADKSNIPANCNTKNLCQWW